MSRTEIGLRPMGIYWLMDLRTGFRRDLLQGLNKETRFLYFLPCSAILRMLVPISGPE
jgi:hypothetical protein